MYNFQNDLRIAHENIIIAKFLYDTARFQQRF